MEPTAPATAGLPHPVPAVSLGWCRARCAAARPGAAGAETEAAPGRGLRRAPRLRGALNP